MQLPMRCLVALIVASRVVPSLQDASLQSFLAEAELTHLAGHLKGSTPQSMMSLMNTAGKSAFVASLKALGIKSASDRRALLSMMTTLKHRPHALNHTMRAPSLLQSSAGGGKARGAWQSSPSPPVGAVHLSPGKGRSCASILPGDLHYEACGRFCRADRAISHCKVCTQRSTPAADAAMLPTTHRALTFGRLALAHVAVLQVPHVLLLPGPSHEQRIHHRSVCVFEHGRLLGSAISPSSPPER